jgi:uncharacterized damage-inducible protein DinB
MTDAPLVPHLRALARHMAWADRLVWTRVHATPAAAGDTKVGDTLHHVHLVQHIFLQAWTQAAFQVRERSTFGTLLDLERWGHEAHAGVLSFLERATAADLDGELRMPWASHFEARAKQPAGVHTLGESALQVFLHTQHHRGQVCSRLRELGGEPPTVDFIVWLWAGRPDGGT